MKTLALIFALSLTFGAFASEELGLSDCSKGDDGSRKVVKVADQDAVSSTNGSETSGN